VSVVTIDKSGVLVIDGTKVFPVGFSDAPYYRGSNPTPPPDPHATPEGSDSLAELASAGGTMIRIGTGGWALAQLDAQLQVQRAWLDAAAARGLGCWIWLGDTPNLPPSGPQSDNEKMLRKIATQLRGHKALVAYKGIDEPANIFRTKKIPAAGMKRAYDVLKQVDPNHPMVVIQSPRSQGDLGTYAPGLDITGADIFPIAYPPGEHASAKPNEDIGIVGDMTTQMVAAAKGKPVWMTLQIAWSGIIKPGTTIRFPTFAQERFMAYQAIVHGARGLVFFGGHLTRVGDPPNVRPIARQVDIDHGWNWTFWRRVLRPVVEELAAHSALHPALVVPDSPMAATCRLMQAGQVTAKTPPDVEFVVRETPTTVYLIAVKRGGQTIRVQFQLPGTKLQQTGRVLFEPPRTVAVTQATNSSTFRDWFAPYDVHVYALPRA
jgi:hypothetical protein